MDETKIHERRWWALAVLCVSLLVITLDNTILNVAIPDLLRDLGATTSQLQWIIDGYTLVFAGLLLTMGSVGDRFGRKSALMVGLVIFGVGSILSGLATGATELIFTRASMGVGAALIMPATLSLLTNIFHDPKERGPGHRRVGRHRRRQRRPRPRARRLPAAALLLGLGVLRERAGHHRGPRRSLVPPALLQGRRRPPPRPPRRRPLDRRPGRRAVGDHRGAHRRLELARRLRPAGVRRDRARRVRALGAHLRAPHARRALLQEPAVHRRQHRRHPRVLRHVRPGLHRHAVPADRPRVQRPPGRHPQPAHGHRHGLGGAPRPPARRAHRHQAGRGLRPDRRGRPRSTSSPRCPSRTATRTCSSACSSSGSAWA